MSESITALLVEDDVRLGQLTATCLDRHQVSTTVVTPLDPPNIGNAPGYNFVGSQGFVHEAAAVQEAISKGLLEHPEMPLDETLAMARIFEKIRAQIGLTYPWDEEGEGAAKKARRATQTPAARPVNAPEGAVFDHAAKLGGEWVSPRRPGGPKGPAPLWCLWHDDMDLVDDDDVDTPLGKGCWEVRWSDRTGSYLARDDVRLCVPTRERLAQAPTPPPKRLAQAPPRPPRPPTPPPAPAPANEGVEDESYDPFGKGARVTAPWSDGKLYEATVLRVNKSSLRVQFVDDSVGSAPREECELLEPAPRAVRLTDEDKRERQELRAMAAADKPALTLGEFDQLDLAVRASFEWDRPLHFLLLYLTVPTAVSVLSVAHLLLHHLHRFCIRCTEKEPRIGE